MGSGEARRNAGQGVTYAGAAAAGAAAQLPAVFVLSWVHGTAGDQYGDSYDGEMLLLFAIFGDLDAGELRVLTRAF
ncbi:hypothetical protein P1P75_35940 [Streptomyces sp. ID05-39B]|uniref:hypothetical protein n=1 Tax=Streptomyces sp. ID05-39B TaxID=3028664 RepID=UPI0029A7E5BA|nr:hypothetical protein [Streptomyces sp. ID05-39B]MDX3531644.1 hypothetical protein [Streptomyces sp. ID05-39B]